MNWVALYFASEWIVRLVALFALPARLRPEAARAWLLLIFVLPWPGLMLFLILGRRALPHYRIELQKQLNAFLESPQAARRFGAAEPAVLSPRLDGIARLAHALAEFPVVGGNRFELLPDYAGAHERMLDDIRSARRHVHLLTYIFAQDATGDRFCEALREAAARGVRCRVLLDQLGSGRHAPATLQRLRDAGIEAYLMMPSHMLGRQRSRLDLRNHRKITVIDGCIGYIGSQNIVNAEAWQEHPNLELTARVTGPLVHQLQVIFLADRFAEARTMLEDEDLFPPPSDGGAAAAQLLTSGPAYKSSNNLEVIVAALHQARTRIAMVTPYFIPPSPLLQAICSAAHRGVAVDLIVPRWGNKLLEALAQHSYYHELLEAGVRIHRYGPHFLHAKHLSIDDDLAIIGSTNLDVRSFLLDAEAVALIYDRDVVREMRRVEEGYLAQAEQITAASWKQRPWIHRGGENLCRLLDALL
jgi:cardiolipin synthase